MNIKNMKQSFLIDEDELIGEGAFSKVYRSGTTESTAIKVYEKSRESAELVEHAKRQHNILQNIQSPYICSLRKSFETNRKFYMVQKFQQGQSLDVQLKKRKRFSCKDALVVFKQLLNAMEYLINKKIMHRDLKPQNIIYRNGKIVLIDFGFACYFHKNDQKILTSVVGTPNYMSPQLLSCKKYNSKSDIWSLGVILYELISGQLPFEGKDTRQLLKEIESKTISFKNNLFSPTAQFLINRCLRISVSERIDWKQLFEWKNTGKLPQSKYNESNEKKFKYQLTSMQKQKQEVNCSCNIFSMFQ